ncbi:FAD-dependent monooxygenase [Streptomyces roseirectus]|uniref:FAD-dependent monooxygenase n=1 Tax=Streptomyces roseirectus TaxID=2768066 RepID=A0A7H0IMQ3_9ACTN|nr:FAD-dependent monooxygenase [Streptomyces roseirectus]QNP74069.1 FAD-dependent monooxygenase [Streptomyces roseirectus]
MKSTERTEKIFDVLVVGAGPSGLLLGCELLSRGVRVRIVDAAPEPTRVPRALSIYPRALDILADQGLRDAVYEVSGTIRTLSYFSERNHLASFHIPEEHAARVLPQYETERILTERLEALGGKVERGVRLLCLENVDFSGRIENTDGVTAVLEGADGIVERAVASYVVGADGAGSAVRGQLGIGFHGSTYGLEFALVDARIDGRLDPEEILYYQGPTGTLAVVPHPGGVFRFLSVLPQGVAKSAGVAMMQEIVDERGPRGIRITEPVWTTVFRVHARLAADFQLGRVFLIGDAAHVHSPAGGQGMNNGLQDAHNLGWKLAAVLRGTSPVSLLDTYGPERSEATRRSVRDTDLHTKAWMAKGKTRVRVRDAGFKLAERTGAVSRLYAPVLAGRRQTYPVPRDTQLPSGVSPCQARAKLPGGIGVGGLFPREQALAHGVTGPHWTLVLTGTTLDAGPWRAQVGHIAARWPHLKTVTVPARSLAAATGCRRLGYHLVRPDGHIAAHGHEHDLSRLEQELAAGLGPGKRG